MSIDSLIAHCIQKDTSISEKGKTASIQRRDGELVLCFETDDDGSKKILGISQCCDGALLYMKHTARPILLFIELKGKDVAVAAKQIESTMLAVQRLINKTIHKDFPKSSDMRAIIVRSGSAPKNQAELQTKFYKATNVKLQFAREKADLRQFLDGSR